MLYNYILNSSSGYALISYRRVIVIMIAKIDLSNKVIPFSKRGKYRLRG